MTQTEFGKSRLAGRDRSGRGRQGQGGRRSDKNRRGPHPRWRRRSFWGDMLRDGFDLGLIVLLLFVPLLLGGRHPAGALAYEVVVLWMATCWLIRNCLRHETGWRKSGVEWLWLAGMVLLIIQLVPMPDRLLSILSSFQSELLPAWFPGSDSGAGFGRWSTVTLVPVATRAGLAMFVAHATLFLVLVQRLDKLADVERLLRWTALAAFSMGAIGLLQYFSGTDRFVWIFADPSRDASRTVTGAFINANHFAHFLILGLGPLIWWVQRSLPRRLPVAGRRGFAARAAGTTTGPTTDAHAFAAMFALGAVVLAIILTRSRGGMAVAAIASVWAVGWLMAARLLGKRSLLALITLLGLAGVALYLHGHQRIQRELETLVDGSWEQLDRGEARRHIWQANLQIARHFPALGAGVGAHREIYKVFFPHNHDVEFTHAESGYLQVLSETGVAGAALMFVALGLIVRQAVRAWSHADTPGQTLALVAVTTGLVASGVHSVFDFPWYIPSCFGVTVALLACLNRLSRIPWEERGGESAAWPLVPWMRYQMMGIWLVLLAALVATQVPRARAAGAWQRYLAVSLQQSPLGLSELARAVEPEYVAELQRREADETRKKARFLQQILDRNPLDARAHQRMADQCILVFQHLQAHSENAIDLISLRDAALASQFPDVASQDRWLRVAVGENRHWLDRAAYHARRSVTLCPLLGRNYMFLSQLDFLRGAGREELAGLLDQAERVRPYDGAVLFAQGREGVLAGDGATATKYWKKAFQYSAEYREQVIRQLALPLGAEYFMQEFQPDNEGIRMLFAFYRAAGEEPSALFLAPLLAERQLAEAERSQGRRAAVMWEKARLTFRYLGQDEESLTCARRAVEAAPLRYQSRLALAQELLRQGQWNEAQEAVQWCLFRRPHDETLRAMFQLANRGQAGVVPPRVPPSVPPRQADARPLDREVHAANQHTR